MSAQRMSAPEHDRLQGQREVAHWLNVVSRTGSVAYTADEMRKRSSLDGSSWAVSVVCQSGTALNSLWHTRGRWEESVRACSLD